MRKPPFVLTLVLVVAAIAGSVVASSADATIYVVHGVPDAVVDVALDGVCVLEAADYTDQAGPMDVPAGVHRVTVSLADPTNPCDGVVVLDVPFLLEDGENVTAVAFLDEACEPTGAKFTNDLSRTEPGKARLTLHHTACAPPVDIFVARDVDAPIKHVIQDFGNGDQITDHLRPGEWYMWISEAGSGVPSVGPVMVKLKPFTTYRAYAVGSVIAGNADIVVFEDETR